MWVGFFCGVFLMDGICWGLVLIVFGLEFDDNLMILVIGLVVCLVLVGFCVIFFLMLRLWFWVVIEVSLMLVGFILEGKFFGCLRWFDLEVNFVKRWVYRKVKCWGWGCCCLLKELVFRKEVDSCLYFKFFFFCMLVFDWLVFFCLVDLYFWIFVL